MILEAFLPRIDRIRDISEALGRTEAALRKRWQRLRNGQTGGHAGNEATQ